MTYEEFGKENSKTMMLFPGTCCNWQVNFGAVIDRLSEKYHVICVNYDGFDGTGSVFDTMLNVTERIEKYITDNFDGRLDGAIGSSLGGSFVGQLVQRENVHIDHAIFGSCDFDQSGVIGAKLQSMIIVPYLSGIANNEKKRLKTKNKLKEFFEMSDDKAEMFVDCFAKFSPESIRNEYYTDLITCLEDDINVEHTKAHIIYANKMGKKYLKRYHKYFHNPDIREFDMQHEQWLFGGEKYTVPVLKAIDEFMETPV